jgi:hypothetical protein
MWIGIYETVTFGEFKNQGFYIQHYDWCYPEHDGPVIATSANKKEVVAKCHEYMKTHMIKAPDYNWGLSFCKGYDKWYKNWWPDCPDYSQINKVCCSHCKKECYTWEVYPLHGIRGWFCHDCSTQPQLRLKLLGIQDKLDALDNDFCK